MANCRYFERKLDCGHVSLSPQSFGREPHYLHREAGFMRRLGQL